MGSHVVLLGIRDDTPILEDIKALTVNAVMPSFPDDSRLTKPESIHIHIDTPTTQTTHTTTETFAGYLDTGHGKEVLCIILVREEREFIAPHYYYTYSPHVPLFCCQLTTHSCRLLKKSIFVTSSSCCRVPAPPAPCSISCTLSVVHL